MWQNVASRLTTLFVAPELALRLAPARLHFNLGNGLVPGSDLCREIESINTGVPAVICYSRNGPVMPLWLLYRVPTLPRALRLERSPSA